MDFIDFLQSSINSLQARMVSLLGEAWIANFISLVFGVLGAIAFFMQLPRKIKPIVMQSGDVVFHITKKNSYNNQSWLDLEKIELTLSISNLKNAVGIMEDMFVRVYCSDSFNPETVVYFPSKIITEENENDFTPFVLGPNSHTSMKIIFGQVEHSRSEKEISTKNHYIIDLFYKIKGKKRPYTIKSIYTYNDGNITNGKMKLKNLTMNIERDKYYKNLRKTEKTAYNGIINFYFDNLQSDIKYRLYYMPKKYFFGLFETISLLLKYVLTNIFAIVISKRIIIGEGRKVRQPRFSWGNKEHRLIAEKTMEKVYLHIEKLIKEINNKTNNDDDKIFLILQENNYLLQRHGKEIKIYMPGDSSIIAHDGNIEKAISIMYDLKESRWGIKYWSYKNKFITPYNMAINILNYFVLQSIVKR
jgi:hypothetical protein